MITRLLLIAALVLLLAAAVSYTQGWTVQEDTVVRVEVKLPALG